MAAARPPACALSRPPSPRRERGRRQGSHRPPNPHTCWPSWRPGRDPSSPPPPRPSPGRGGAHTGSPLAPRPPADARLRGPGCSAVAEVGLASQRKRPRAEGTGPEAGGTAEHTGAGTHPWAGLLPELTRTQEGSWPRCHMEAVAARPPSASISLHTCVRGCTHTPHGSTRLPRALVPLSTAQRPSRSQHPPPSPATSGPAHGQGRRQGLRAPELGGQCGGAGFMGGNETAGDCLSRSALPVRGS